MNIHYSSVCYVITGRAKEDVTSAAGNNDDAGTDGGSTPEDRVRRGAPD